MQYTLNRSKQQQGLAIIEFTWASVVLFLLIFSIISIGYFMFVLQAVNESTRHAARLAAVCPISSSSSIATIAANNGLVSGISGIEVEYLDVNGAVLASPSKNNVRFVRARAVGLNYQFISLLNFLGSSGLVSIPSFETTIPSESLGAFSSGVTGC
ncbi:hypothetical protein BCU68_06055 [Vibrio sp. 10N.286.49.B3]|uniref:TadE/TadG family type IV pilus assembly protein n=1 Tax=Vibrio sp. 10N.286.49.B3 TaxID=1880855 RepID=UPI000C83750C|nr:TadE family protein [Vibrio sp. 10N.286.49.B3]PMH41240.1 hypothetical protein BCU68_06055 [Vibrio sp. 10N.286.49.B3]